MAQQAKGVWRRKARRLARRLGVGGRVGAAVLLAVLLAAAAVTAVALQGQQGVVIERRGADVEVASEADAPGPQDVEGGEPGDKGDADEQRSTADEPASVAVVHVDGAVTAPGVYALEGEPRVNDAILAAGGLADDAVTTGLNLAAPVADGEKVHVPRVGEDVPVASADGGSAQGAGGGAAVGQGLININTATVEELCELPGVGESTAKAIVQEREKNGLFTTPEDLMRVSGIGEKKFAKLEGSICV